MEDIRSMLVGTVKERTATIYTENWEDYMKFCDGDMSVATQSKTLARWRGHLIQERGFATATVNQRMMSVKKIIKVMHEYGEIDRDTLLDFKEVSLVPQNAMPERRRDNAVALTPKQVRQMIDILRPKSEHDVMAVHDRAVLLVLATTGMRVGEVVKMRTTDIVKVGEHYVVRNILSKHDKDAREVPISEETVQAIEDWLHVRPVQSAYVFPDSIRKPWSKGFVLFDDAHLSRVHALNIVRRVGRNIGIPNLKCHDFRRFVGTQLAKENPRVAQKVLGHSSIETTMKYYELSGTPIGATEGLF